jgi:hypothetical protein
MIRVLVLNSILSNLVPFFCLGGAGLPVAYQFIILFVQLDCIAVAAGLVCSIFSRTFLRSLAGCG